MRPQAIRRLSLTLFVMLFIANSFSAVINWQPYSKSIFKKAQQQHRLVLIFEKATWCPWCKRMKNQTFTDDKIVTLINKHYIPVLVDIDSDVEAANRYPKSAVPANIIIDSEGKEIDSRTGYMTASELASFLKSNIHN